MGTETAMNNIICIAGPTASGKTALAVELARELHGEVVSCDSMQIYRGMDIGTAKPTREEMGGIPHHMLDVCEPEEDFSVSRYCEMATPIVDDILARGKTAIIAGGTGLYMDSLIRGIDFAPFPSTGVRQRLETRLEEGGLDPLVRELEKIDPEALARSQNNPRRILRALEVYYETGETITAHDQRTRALPPRYRPLRLALDFQDRQTLYRRIHLRVDQMLEQGLVEEIRTLLARGVPTDCTAMQAIGYKEFVDALAGRSTLEDAVNRVCQASRRYAKRQLTWFRRDPTTHWILRGPETGAEEIIAAARQIIQENDN